MESRLVVIKSTVLHQGSKLATLELVISFHCERVGFLIDLLDLVVLPVNLLSVSLACVVFLFLDVFVDCQLEVSVEHLVLGFLPQNALHLLLCVHL